MIESTERLILAGDIGGTNTNLALVAHERGRFDILLSRRYSTQAETSLIAPIARFLEEAARTPRAGKIDVCCISAAGPVKNGSIQLTNAPWSIRASEISAHFGLPVHLINDFSAISYGVALIDPRDAEQIAHMPHTDGSVPPPGEGIALVIGAGTGLGVGYMDLNSSGRCKVYPSEGGHSSMPCWDELSFGFYRWLKRKIGRDPSAELAVSGQGIDNIFSYLCSREFDPAQSAAYGMRAEVLGSAPGKIASSIAEKPADKRPALIASGAAEDPRCALAMELFCGFYSRVVSSLAAAFYPSAGIYLAGGISSKNERFLLEGDRFMRGFEINSEPHIRDFLSGVAVMIVRDYSVSLVGAANAAVQLAGQTP